MCVIAYKPKGIQFKRDELSEMFWFNPDGAGFAVRNPENGRVIFKKGIMIEEEFVEKVTPFNKPKWEVVIHCRITSRGVTSPKQTHPFKAGNMKLMNHLNINGDLYFMNGTITDITEKPGYNDTMSFIEVMQLNKAKVNQDLIDMIGDITDAKWLCINKKGIFFTKDFIKKNGKYYSNLYHEGIYGDYYYDCCTEEYKSFNNRETSIEDNYNKKTVKKIKKNKMLYEELEAFIEEHCNFGICEQCQGECLLNFDEVIDIEELLWLALKAEEKHKYITF